MSRADGDFNPRGRFGGYDDWAVRVTWVTGEVTGIGSFSLFLLLSLLFIFLSRFAKESGCFLFNPLILQVIEDTFLLLDNATKGEGEVSDGFVNVVFGGLKFYLGSFQGVLVRDINAQEPSR